MDAKSAEEKIYGILHDNKLWSVQRLWEIGGPPNTQVKRMACYAIWGREQFAGNRPFKGVVIVQYIDNGDGGMSACLFASEDAIQAKLVNQATSNSWEATEAVLEWLTAD